MSTQPQSTSGLALAVSAFTLFSLMPVYLQWLHPLSGYTVLFHRILWTNLLLLMVLALTGNLKNNLAPLIDLKQWPGLIAGSILIGIQWGVFVWAPLNNQTLDLSLGYFLLPLIMVVLGKWIYKETLRIKQWIALMLATIGVGIAYWQSNGLSMVVILIIVGYPLYLILRRHQRLPTFAAFFIENLLLLPIAIIGIMLAGDIYGGPLPHPFAYELNWILLFLGVAVLGSIPMLCYIAANKRLPMSLLGLISYLEPTLIFIFAYFVIGENLPPTQVATYGLIGAGLLFTLWDGFEQWHIQKRYSLPPLN